MSQAKIPLGDSLSIDSLVAKNEDGPPGKYHLRGVVHHVGTTAFSGHYTTCAKRTLDRKGGNGEEKSDDDAQANAIDKEEQWVFFDDRAGAKKGEKYVNEEKNQKNCYMALYELDRVGVDELV